MTAADFGERLRRTGEGLSNSAPPILLTPRGVLVARCVIAVLVAHAAAFMVLFTGLETALAGATLGLAVVIAVETACTYLWIRPYLAAASEGTTRERDQSTPADENGNDDADAAMVARNAEILRDAARLAISTQGIVLGLVSFSSARELTTTAKVGASSLVIGVLVGVILYFLVAYGISDARRRGASAYLYGLTFWALGYGLICIGVWLWQQ